MKKLLIFLVLIPFIFSGFILGCSDDDDNGGTTGPSVDVEEFEYYFGLMYIPSLRASWFIQVYAYEGSEITDLQLLINGIDIAMADYQGLYWTSSVPVELDEGQTNSFDLTINQLENHTFTLKNVCYPTVNWPLTWFLGQNTEVSWTLAEDSDYQDFIVSGISESDDEEKYQNLDPSDRSYTIPANYISTGYDLYTLMLMEYNYIVEGEFIAGSISFSGVYYGILEKNNISTDKLFKISREIIEQKI
ncbi:MAG: hypothetical protein KAU01_08195 [Candidatus Cloacimonetes bacterium]|nr:hypothetical protein [Candidatus Cloacimonadota bacterium]